MKAFGFFVRIVLPACALAIGLSSTTHAAMEELFYIGTYTGHISKGIYSAKLNIETGELSVPVLAVDMGNPSALAISGDGKYVYACNELDSFHGKPSGAVTASLVVGDGSHLKKIEQQASEGQGPCALTLSKEGRAVLVANYGSGSIAALPILANGSLGKATSVVQHTGSSTNPDRQEGPHAHQIVYDPQGEYVYAVDLGLDRIRVYRFDPTHNSLVGMPEREIIVKSGTGPRHIVFNAAGNKIYVLGELASNLTVYKLERASGYTEVIQTLSLLPDTWNGENTSAELQIDRDGKYLYASNRGDNSLVVMEIQSDGQVKYIQHISCGGRTPRNFVIDPSGKFILCANQDSNSVLVFRIDPETGELHAGSGKLTVGKPVSLVFSRTR